MTDVDQTLTWPRLRSGDQTACLELYQRNHDKLLSYFRRRLPDREAADDCAADVFVRAFDGLARGARPRESADQWLWGIAHHVLVEQYGAAAVRSAQPIEDLPLAVTDPETYGKREAFAALYAVAAGLSGTGRQVLTAYLDLSLQEMSEVKGNRLATQLGWHRQRVDRELHRAMKTALHRVGLLAVARSINACPEAIAAPQLASLIERADPALLPSKGEYEALEAHLAAGCQGCAAVADDARQEQHWAVNSALALLAVNDQPDKDERRRAIIAWWLGERPTLSLATLPADVGAQAAADSSGAVPVTLRVASSLRSAVTLAETVHSNPALIRLGAVAGAIIILLAGALFTSDSPPPSQTEPSSIAAAPVTVAPNPPIALPTSVVSPASPTGTPDPPAPPLDVLTPIIPGGPTSAPPSTSGPTDPGPPPHGRLITTLTPTHLFPSPYTAQLVTYAAAEFEPDRISLEPRQPQRQPAILPYALIPDAQPHTYQIALHVRSTGGEYRMYYQGWQLRANATVPGGDTIVRFTDTVTLARSGWWYWIVTNASGAAWQVTAIDLYEVTDSGPSPAAAPDSHPDPTPPPGRYGRLDLTHVRTATTTLTLYGAHSVSVAGGAGFVPSTSPAGTRQEVALGVRVPDSNPHTYRFVCTLRTTAPARYQLDGQMVATQGGETTIQFITTAQGEGWRSWSLTELNQQTWVFRSCDVYQDS